MAETDIAWSGDENGVRSCHVWRFEPVPGGGTRIHRVEPHEH